LKKSLQTTVLFMKAYMSIINAFNSCKKWCLSVFLVYCASCLIGIVMVHSHNHFALEQRDHIVGKAVKSDATLISYNSGSRFKAAMLDFGGNLFIGSIIQTALGLGIVVPYFTVAYQGWVGGIVSVDGSHRSRLTTLKSALYYFIVFFSQTIAYSLCIGSGIKAGIETYKRNKNIPLSKFRLDRDSLLNISWMYVLAIPVFFLASCFEFLSGWN
jgi:hypothetical protein